MIYTVVVQTGRGIYKYRSYQKRLHELADTKNENLATNVESVDPECQETVPIIDMYSEWANRLGKISQDVPLNRFINFIFYEALFLSLLILNMTNPFLNIPAEREEYQGRHIVEQVMVFLYLLPGLLYMLIAYCLLGKRIFKKFFWILALVKFIFLTTSIICNFILYTQEDLYLCFKNHITNSSSAVGVSSWENNIDNLTVQGANCEFEEILFKTSFVTFAIGNFDRK